jgi:hypothetical protein
MTEIRSSPYISHKQKLMAIILVSKTRISQICGGCGAGRWVGRFAFSHWMRSQNQRGLIGDGEAGAFGFLLITVNASSPENAKAQRGACLVCQCQAPTASAQ